MTEPVRPAGPRRGPAPVAPVARVVGRRRDEERDWDGERPTPGPPAPPREPPLVDPDGHVDVRA